MPQLKLKIRYSLNDEAVISPSSLQENYLFGIPMCSPDGRKMSPKVIREQILNAQTTIENLLNIKLKRQVVEESRDFQRQEFMSWGYIRSMYPIKHIDNLQGWINGVCQTDYPKEWLSLKQTDGVAVFRNVYLIPNTGSKSGATMTNNSLIYNGIAPHLGWFGRDYIPNYWRLRYVTGWSKIPADIMDVMSKLAAINVLAIIGDVLYGIGITNISISLDGVSQSTPLTRSGQGGLFSGRIKLYMDQINEALPSLRSKYRGITFEVL